MNILLIEDDEKIAKFIINGFAQDGATVDHLSNGVDGLSAIENSTLCDIVILDIMLPKLDGLTLLEIIRKKGIELPVLILSAKNSVDDRVTGLSSGADDYLVKPFAFSELSARVSALTRRKNIAEKADNIIEVKDLKLDLLRKRVTRSDRIIDLQPLELKLLEYLLRNRGRIVSKTMIMEHVWDFNFDPQTNVVEARISQLRKKIDTGNSDTLIKTVRGVGYVIKDR